jgi:addiction module HigA family antidote
MLLLSTIISLYIGKKGVIMVRIPSNRVPTHPGEMLLEEFLRPMKISQRELSQALHVPYQRINEVINQRRGITPGTALRLAKYFGVSEDFWLNLQLRWDIFHARSKEVHALEHIQPYPHRDMEHNHL